LIGVGRAFAGSGGEGSAGRGLVHFWVAVPPSDWLSMNSRRDSAEMRRLPRMLPFFRMEADFIEPAPIISYMALRDKLVR